MARLRRWPLFLPVNLPGFDLLSRRLPRARSAGSLLSTLRPRLFLFGLRLAGPI